MYFIKLYYFYTVWSFCIHILGNIFDFNTYNFAIVVFVASIFLNIYYLRIYNFKQNIIRIPFELIFHIAPIYFANKKPNTFYKSTIIIYFITLLYLYTFSCEEIFNLYYDPYNYNFIKK